MCSILNDCSESNQYVKTGSTLRDEKGPFILSISLFGKRLEKYGEFNTIDTLVRTYPQYTHDDIFDLPVVMVHNMILYNKDLDYIQSRKEEIQRQVELAKKH